MTADRAHLAAALDRIITELVDLRAQLQEPAEPPSRAPRSHEFLDTITLGQRFTLSRGQVARICAAGADARIAGIEKDGVNGPGWRATVQAFLQARSLKS